MIRVFLIALALGACATQPDPPRITLPDDYRWHCFGGGGVFTPSGNWSVRYPPDPPADCL